MGDIKRKSSRSVPDRRWIGSTRPCGGGHAIRGGAKRSCFISTTFFAAIFLTFVAFGARAQTPNIGTLIGTNDGDVLNYECYPISTSRISCEFVQVLLTHRDAIEPSPENARQLLEEVGQNEQICAVFGRLSELQSGHSIPADSLSKEARQIFENLKDYKEKNPAYYEVEKENLAAFQSFCISPTLASAQRFLQESANLAAITCEPFVNKYSQNFVLVDTGLWVVESKPTGSCGIVNTSKFIASELSPNLWSYIASKTITNKNGNSVISCDKLDETEQPYPWNGPGVVNNCVIME